MRMTKFYNELEQSWRKLKQNRPEVAKAIEESDEREYLGHGGWKSASQTTPCDDLVYRAPMQTEADKFLAKWGGKKICKEGMERHAYHLVTGVMDHNRVHIKDQDGQCGYIVLRVSDNWKLWESPIKLDTRRVAGWWMRGSDYTTAHMVISIGTSGKSLSRYDAQIFNIKDLEGENYTFSKDPSVPLDQWQTLSEICGGES
jgi:hypothetical protein